MNDTTTESTNRVPVTVLTGFLGSGKTTLLNRILTEEHGLRIAVIENEFGEIGIDNDLVINADEEIFEMNNGCICCTVRGDLIRILNRLMQRRTKFDRILIETTGLADPGPVAQTFFVDDDLEAQFFLDGIITMVDAAHVDLHIHESDECREQIAFADILLLNKADLVEPEKLADLETRLRAMNGLAKIYRTEMGQIDMEKVLQVGGFDLSRALEMDADFLEPEYPFEWGGALPLERGPHIVVMHEGPDPEMDLLFLKADNEEGVVDALQEQAARLFSHDPVIIDPKGELHPGASLYRLILLPSGETTFTLQVEEPGYYGLFTQHRPDEFDMEIRNHHKNLPFEQARVYDPDHEHDETVTSVGIRESGALNPALLNQWLRHLLATRGVDIFRMKGVLHISGEDRRFVFQGVHMLFDGQPDRLWGPEEDRINQLVFIGRNLDRQELTSSFRGCLQ